MTAMIRIELLKLRTIRSTWALAAAGAALTAADSALIAAQSGKGKLAALTTPAGLRDVIATTGFTLLISAILGILASTGELRHHTAAHTYLASPKRSRVLAAKAAAAGIAGAAVGAVGAVLSVAAGLIFLAAHGYPVTLAGTTITRYALGTVLASALLAVLGVGLGYLVRLQLPAVAGVLLWAVFAESTLSNVAHPVAPYLPFTAATTLAGARLGSDGFGFPNFPAATALPFFAAAALIAGAGAAVAAFAAGTSLKADVT